MTAAETPEIPLAQPFLGPEEEERVIAVLRSGRLRVDRLARRAWRDDRALALPPRAMRLLDVTGLQPTDLRSRAGDPAVQAAALAFLESHEPDLVACAAALDVTPAALVTARAGLER